MSFDFIDLDLLIEKYENHSVSQIFEEKGETYFRDIEAKLLRSISSYNDSIISVGGGTPIFHANMDWMNQHGKTVYLKLTGDQLLSRLNQPGQIEKRPLLQNKSDEELKNLIHSMLESRSIIYEKAHIILHGFGPHESTLPDLLTGSF